MGDSEFTLTLFIFLMEPTLEKQPADDISTKETTVNTLPETNKVEDGQETIKGRFDGMTDEDLRKELKQRGYLDIIVDNVPRNHLIVFYLEATSKY